MFTILSVSAYIAKLVSHSLPHPNRISCANCIINIILVWLVACLIFKIKDVTIVPTSAGLDYVEHDLHVEQAYGAQTRRMSAVTFSNLKDAGRFIGKSKVDASRCLSSSFHPVLSFPSASFSLYSLPSTNPNPLDSTPPKKA